MELSEAFVAQATARAAAAHRAPQTGNTALPRHSGASLSAAAAVATVGVLSSARRHRPKLLKRRLAKVTKAAVPPESIDLLHPHVWSGLEEQSTQLLQHFTQGLQAGDNPSNAEGVAAAVQQLTEIFSEAAGRLAREIVPPAYAADAKPIELDPNVTYLYGADGAVLVDPMNNKPLPDDWWNGFIGFQAGLIKQIDQALRDNGVEQAFGWTIVAYTAFIKLLFFPLQQGQLKSTSMMQLLSPKVKEIQEKYKDDPDTQQRLLGQLYGVMDVNPLGGCLPVFLQLPIFWSLYGVWRRLAAEKFPHYTEGWLWVPSLAQPNPDFQFKYDWLLQFEDGKPAMGWENYLSYLVFPVLLVGFTVFQQQQAQAARPKTGNEEDPQNLVLQVLPWISVYFIGSLSLQLPQAVSVYYSMNTALSVLQTAVVKFGLRQEIPGYEEFERTGKFPDGTFENMVRSQTPPPKTLHEAALRGEVKFIEEMLADESLDINKWDEKKISQTAQPAGCRGHLDAVKVLLKRGADVTMKDGQDNTMLHYAAGYGHMAVLELTQQLDPLLQELLEASDKEGLDAPELVTDLGHQGKGQSVVDAARVNRKGQVVDFLCERLGVEAPEVKAPIAVTASGSLRIGPEQHFLLLPGVRTESMIELGVSDIVSNHQQIRLESAVTCAAGEAATAMRAAVEKLKSNPEAVEQARKMMGKIPPQMLQMSGPRSFRLYAETLPSKELTAITRLSGNKISAEQAQKARHAEFEFLTGGRRFVLKAMDAMSEMSTEARSSNSGKAHLPNMLRTSWKKRIWRPTSLDLSQALTGASM
ncbi:ALB3.2 [Symbiodinium microadriaticum]|nr:ALB3.2 [Symbiodinium microadriaticum]